MDFSSIIRTVAPWMASALGGPLAGIAVTAAADALGLSEKTTEAVKQAISGATPEQMLALKNADQEFQAHMLELGFKNISDLEKIAAEDRKDARGMQVANKSFMPAVLSTIIVIGYLGVLGFMLAGKASVADSQALLLMLGSLGTGFGMVLSFWFGSTRTSEDKTRLLAAAQPVKP